MISVKLQQIVNSCGPDEVNNLWLPSYQIEFYL